MIEQTVSPTPVVPPSARPASTTGRGLMALVAAGILLVALGPLVFDAYLLNILIKAFFFAIVAVTVD
ncbi:MAG: branched-chain amino acid ABC transporter substrate-binding protein, partial [Pseudomonadota bacterium]